QRIPLLGAFSLLPAWRSWKAALWLTSRQMGLFPLWLTLGCIFAALLLPGGGPLLWPLLTLLMGTLCGLWMFFDDQKGGYRFLGDQGLPLWRIWVVRNLLYGGLALAMLLILLVPLVLQYVLRVERPDQHSPPGLLLIPLFGSGLLTETASQGWFLLAPEVYGFVVGQFAGLLFRKPIVSLVIGLGLAILLLGIWAPSIVLGGVHTWQIMAIPLLLLLAILWLLHAWATDRFASRRVVVGLAGMTGLGVALTTLGLWYRVHEIPDVSEPAGYAEFVASIPSPEKNEAGRAVQEAVRQVQQIPARSGMIGQGWRPTNMLIAKPNQERAREDVGFYKWLDENFDKDWAKRLLEVARKEPGMAAAAMGNRLTRSLPGSQFDAYSASQFLQVMGLRSQELGKPEVLVDYLDAGLALLRNLQNGGTYEMLQVARSGQQGWCEAIRVWLSQLSGRPDLLKRVGEILDRHRKWLPPNYRQNWLAEYLQAKQRLEDPISSLHLDLLNYHPGERSSHEWEAVVYSLHVPWEKARLERRVRVAFAYPAQGKLQPSPDTLLYYFTR
ncbi:MAG: hypothetical protein ACKO23_18070, partial [Gemmataceae bacterium]